MFARAEPDPRGQMCVFQVSLLRDGNVSKNTENSLPKINTSWAVPGGSGAGTLSSALWMKKVRPAVGLYKLVPIKYKLECYL